MNKYTVLTNKLNDIIKYIDCMEVEHEASREYLLIYKDFVKKILQEVKCKFIAGSQEGNLGLIRGISDYDEICNDNGLWNLLCDAENYYKSEYKNL